MLSSLYKYRAYRHEQRPSDSASRPYHGLRQTRLASRASPRHTGGYCVPQLALPYWQVLRTANWLPAVPRQTGGGK